MSRKIKIFTAVISFFLTVQLVSAADTPIPAEPLLKNKKTTKLTGDLPRLRDSWVTTQSDQSASLVKPNSLINIIDNYVVVDAVATDDDAQTLATQLRERGMRKVSVYGRVVSGQFPLSELGNASFIKELRFMRPAYAMTNVGLTTSQGDVAMNTDDVKTTYGVDGTGITIGTLSDSYNCLGGAATDVINNDLPSGVNVLDDTATCPGGSDEGRAMMQLIHDVAPGASQAFHTAFNGQADFAQGIQDLKNAGADIINDDVFYFAEPFFQDGIIAQSIESVVAAGVPYFTAAGNSARNSYQNGFNPSGLDLPGGGGSYDAHDFDPGAGVDILQAISVPLGATVSLSLQWDQPFASVSGSGSTNDLDFVLYNAAGTGILASSTDGNIGGDPVEIIVYNNTSGSTTINLAIGKYTPAGGPNPGTMKYVGFRNLTISEHDTASSTAVGHSNAPNVVSVGAAYYQNTPPFGVSPPVAESFSSAGGTPTLFDTAGNSVNILRNKPDIVAPDGTNTTFFGSDSEPDGFPNFYGTSAAAPHAAAAAALMLDHNSAYTPSTIISLMETTAIDMDVAGYDHNTGHGLIDIEAALVGGVSPPPKATLISPNGTITDTTPTYTWNAVSGSTWYNLWVDDSTGNVIKKWYTSTQTGCASGAGTCSITPTTALASGAGKWYIQTYNAAGNGPWSTVMNFTVSAGAPPAATLVSPAGTITDTTPTYSWNAVSSSTWYNLWVDDSTGNVIKKWYTSTQAGCASGTGTCSVTPTTVLASGAGKWYIQTYNAAGNGPWSTAMNFTVSAGKPPAATLISPTGAITDTTPTYTWNAVSSSTWYNIWIDDSTGKRLEKWYTATQAGCASGTGTCSVTPTTILASGAGKWYIQTYNAAGNGPWSTAMNFTVSAGKPPAATLISPTGTITDTTPTYTWNAVSSSTYYYLWVDDSTGNKIKLWYTATQAGCASGTGTCSVTPTTVLASGAGKWYIQTWNSSGLGPWSSGKNFNLL